MIVPFGTRLDYQYSPRIQNKLVMLDYLDIGRLKKNGKPPEKAFNYYHLIFTFNGIKSIHVYVLKSEQILKKNVFFYVNH